MINGDAIDLARAVLGSGDSIDVRQWPIVTTIRSVTLGGGPYEAGDTMVEFDGRDQWLPGKSHDVHADGTGGDTSFTLWIGCQRAGVWHVLAAVNCMRDGRGRAGECYIPTGPLMAPGQIDNVLYYASPPLLGYRPTAGEDIALFVTTGCTRRKNSQPTGQPVGRSNVVLVPFRAGATVFEGGGAPAPPAPVPPLSDDWKAVALQLSQAIEKHTLLIQHLQDRADARVELCTALEADLRDKLRQLDERLVILEDRPATPVPTQAVFRVSYRDVALNREIIAGLR